MKNPIASRRLALLLLGWGLLAAPLAAEEKDLEKEIQALRAEVARLRDERSEGARLEELERRIDLLAAEIERSRTGGALEAEPSGGVPGFGPAASKVYRTHKGVSIGGYGEALFEHFADEREDGEPAEASDVLDQLRLVAYLGYKFSDSILFNSELEFEHATTGEGDEEKGEVSVEQAYLDFKPWKSAGIPGRAGARSRSASSTSSTSPPSSTAPVVPRWSGVIVPTTWHEVGGGVFGEAGPLQWRAYVVAGLSSEGFEGAQGIREGRQGGAQSRARRSSPSRAASTSRASHGLLGGCVALHGQLRPGWLGGRARIRGRVTLYDVHAQYERRGLQLRALYAHTSIGDAALINAANGLEGGRVGGRAPVRLLCPGRLRRDGASGPRDPGRSRRSCATSASTPRTACPRVTAARPGQRPGDLDRRRGGEANRQRRAEGRLPVVQQPGQDRDQSLPPGHRLSVLSYPALTERWSRQGGRWARRPPAARPRRRFPSRCSRRSSWSP